jgi:alpha-beta hydrolase superfamily lysophospholipase
VNESTTTLRTTDGLPLFFRRWWDSGASHRWTFVMIHGLGEHGGRYRHVAEWFAPKGVIVYAMDQRGHGNSGGPRGDAPSLRALVDDADAIVTRARDESDGPLVLIGHSFGGLISIAYGLDRPARIDRAIFSAPLLIPKVKVPAWKRSMAAVLPKVAPRLAVSNEVDPKLLSHDPEVAPAYVADPLVHDRITGGLYSGTIARGEAFIARAPELKVPFIMLHGADDQIVDPNGSQRFFDRATITDRTLCIYPGMYHEIFNEVDRERVFKDIDGWLSRPVAAPPTSSAPRS